MPIVRMPDGTNVRFDDNMSKEQIRSMIATKFPDFAANNTPQRPTFTPDAEALKQIQANNEAYNSGGKSVVNGLRGVADGITGFIEGGISGLGRIASGATLGATDWIDRKTGGNLKRLDEKLQARADESGLGVPNEVVKFATEMGGLGKGASKLIMQGANTIPQMIGKGAIEGGIFGATSSDNLNELPKNALGGAAVGGIASAGLGTLQKGIQRFFPALNAQGKAKSLEDAFADRESTIALKRGAKASQQISDEIAQEMPVVKDNINSKMDNAVKNIIGETPDIEGIINDAKTKYSDYMVMNANNPVNLDSLRNSYKKFTPFEKKTLKDIVKNAKFETNAGVGTVEHTHQMRMAVDDAIDAAMKKSNNRHVPSLQKIRKSLDEILKTDVGYKAIDKDYEQAMRVKKAYDSGYAATKKSKPQTFANDLERQAWVSGVNDNLQNNLVNTDSNYAKNIANNLSILKNGVNADELKGLKSVASKLSKQYTRASDIDRIVNKESATENLPFWREVLESVGSTIGATVGGTEKALYGLSDIGTARRILNVTADSKAAANINALMRNSVPSISALTAKRLADYKENQ
jgi:hypothetical protein